VQSEYSWTTKYIVWEVTPGQVLVWADRIRRRQALHMAEQLELMYLAAAAAQGGKQAFRALRSTVKRLRIEAGVERPPDPEDMIRTLGLTDRRRDAQRQPPPAEAGNLQSGR